MLERHRELVGDDLGQRGFVGLPLARCAGKHEHPADGIDAHPDALVRAEPRVLDEERESKADRPPGGARLLALRCEAVRAHGFGDSPQALRVVPAVVAAGTVVAGDQADVVRKFVGLDQVARAEQDPVEPEARGRQVQHPLHHEHRLGPAGATHRGDRHAVGVEGRECHLVVRNPVRAGHAHRGEDRHDDAPRDEGATIVHERVAQGHDPAFARQPQLDVVPLVALLCDRQEMLVACLDELHGTPEVARQERHQDVLGVDDRLGAESAADVLGDDAHGVLGQPEVAGEQPAQDLRRLRR